MYCVNTEPHSSCDWHSHPFEEFTLVTDSETVNGHANQKFPVAHGTLFLYRRGEPHGYWNGRGQNPRFWVLHFTADHLFTRDFERLTTASPRQRRWQLNPAQIEMFQWMFIRLLLEHTHQRSHFQHAEAAWLPLLLVTVQRWASSEPGLGGVPDVTNPELLELWHVVNQCAASADRFNDRIRQFPNYDSLRHAFRKAFGSAPSQMLMTLRMQHARTLLLESRRSIKEIAAQLGYARQHEFTRGFTKHVGASPTEWRRNPAAHAASRWHRPK